MENMEICWQDTRIAQTFGWMTMRMKFVHYIVPNPLQIWNLRCRWLQGASTIRHKTVQTWIQPNHGLKHLDDMLVVLWLMHDLKAKDSAGFGIAHHKPTVGFLANSDGGLASSACTFGWCMFTFDLQTKASISNQCGDLGSIGWREMGRETESLIKLQMFVWKFIFNDNVHMQIQWFELLHDKVVEDAIVMQFPEVV